MGVFGSGYAMRLPIGASMVAPEDTGSASGVPIPVKGGAPSSRATPLRRGMFGGGFLSWLTPERLQTIGAGLRQAGGEQGVLDNLLQRRVENARNASQDAWQQQVQQRQVGAWNTADKDTARLTSAATAWAQSLPPGPQRDAAQTDSVRAYQQYMPQLFQPRDRPLTDEERQSFHLRPGTSAVIRNGQVDVLQNPPQATGGNGSDLAAFGLTPQDASDMGAIVGLSGMPVGDITGSRDRRINSPVMHEAMEVRRRMNLSPGTYAAIRLAYTGDRHSFQQLQAQRDSVAASEGSARAALRNITTLQRNLPRGQISNIPSANDALQTFNRTLGGSGPVAAYVGGIITARTEYARVISGSNSPPVEAMHEAERVLPTNITPAQLSSVMDNLQREMEFRTQSFDSVLGDIQERVGFGDDTTPPPPADPLNIRR